MLKLLNENEPVRKGRMKEERGRKEEHKKARMKAGREGQRNRRQVSLIGSVGRQTWEIDDFSTPR